MQRAALAIHKDYISLAFPTSGGLVDCKTHERFCSLIYGY